MQVNQYSIFIACESLLVIQKWMMTSYGIRSEQAQYSVFHSNTYNIVVVTYISYKALVVSNLIIHENYTLLYTTLSTSTAQFVHVIKVIYMCLGIPIGCVMSNGVSTSLTYEKISENMLKMKVIQNFVLINIYIIHFIDKVC